MSMLLTLSQPSHARFGDRGTHDFNPTLPPHLKPRFSPLPKPNHPVTQLRAASASAAAAAAADDDKNMATPHRGLPPPAAMNLPDPSSTGRQAAPSLGQPLGVMPAPPNQWHGQEESMRNWLVAKAEEDRRKQEEEKTRQESLRLEQRRVEQAILRESLQGGVPPHMVPMIFAGVGGASLAQTSLDWLHQHTTQLQQAAHHQQAPQTSPDSLSQARKFGPGAYHTPPSAVSQGIPHPLDAANQPPPSAQNSFAGFRPTSAPRSAAQAQLPRLTTNEMFIHQPPTNPGSAHPLQQSQLASQDAAAAAAASSPSIYFHHWVPPNESGRNPQTPASRGRRDEDPSSAHPGSHASESEYKESPRKRKAVGGHHANPPPASSQHGSPSLASTSGANARKPVAHQRSRSAMSPKDETRRDGRKEEDDTVPTLASQPTREEEAPVVAGAESRGDGETASFEARRSHQPQRPPSRQHDR